MLSALQTLLIAIDRASTCPSMLITYRNIVLFCSDIVLKLTQQQRTNPLVINLKKSPMNKFEK